MTGFLHHTTTIINILNKMEIIINLDELDTIYNEPNDKNIHIINIIVGEVSVGELTGEKISPALI